MQRIKPSVHVSFPNLDCKEGKEFIDYITRYIQDTEEVTLKWDEILGSFLGELKKLKEK
jgi:hypothetical protein